MADNENRRKRVATYINETDKKRFLMLAQQAGMSESRYLAHWIAILLEHKGPSSSSLPQSATPAGSNSSAASGISTRKSRVLSVRLNPSDFAQLKAEADTRQLPVGGLLTGILRGRYRHDLYFSDAEAQALIGSVIALSEVRTELARLQRNFGNRSLEALEALRQQCQKLKAELEAHAQAIQNLLAGNIKTWRQAS